MSYRQFQKRKAPLPPLGSEAPYLSYWIHPVNQPAGRRKAREIEIAGKAVSSVVEAPYISYWKQPTNEPLRNRVLKRQQPSYIHPPFPALPTEPPYLTYWKHPTEEPLRNRVRSRQQPASEWVPPIITPGITAANDVSMWVHPTNQPYRRKSKEIDINGGTLSSITYPPYVTFWKQPGNQPRITKRRQQPQQYGNFWADNQPVNNILASQWYKPTNQPLNNRKPKRQQPRYSTQFMPAIPSEPPYLSYWKQPITQPRITKKRQQPAIIDVFWADNAPVNAILVSQWDKQQPQPLRNRAARRQQPRYLAQFMPPLPSQAPYITYWRPPLSQPLRRPGRRQQPRQQLAPTQPVKSWMHTAEQPRRKQRRMQPQTNWNPWYETTANTNLVSQWKRSRDQQFFVPKKKRQQPGISSLNWANIYPHLSTPLMSWKQPINQPVRARRPTVRYVFKQAYVNLASLAITHTLPITIDQLPQTIYLDEEPSVIELSQNDDVISLDSSPSTIEIEQNSNKLVLR